MYLFKIRGILYGYNFYVFENVKDSIVLQEIQ